MALSLTTAQNLLRAAVSAAERRGLEVSVVVVDSGGYLLAAARMDGAPLLSPDIALGKASAAALFRRPSGELAQRWAPGTAIPQAMIMRTGGRFVNVQGALPIRPGDEVVGAVGVSGATSHEDEEIAQAAIDTLERSS